MRYLWSTVLYLRHSQYFPLQTKNTANFSGAKRWGNATALRLHTAVLLSGMWVRQLYALLKTSWITWSTARLADALVHTPDVRRSGYRSRSINDSIIVLPVILMAIFEVVRHGRTHTFPAALWGLPILQRWQIDIHYNGHIYMDTTRIDSGSWIDPFVTGKRY